MAAKKKTDEQKTPETFDELRALDGFHDLPDMLPAQEFDVTTSLTFGGVETRLTELMDGLQAMGAFDTERTDVDQTEANIRMSEIVLLTHGFLKGLCVDEDAWEAWCRGCTGGTLFYRNVTIVRFYQVALGKSDASKTRSANAE